MGSMGRAMRRNQEKAAYKKFQKAWNKEQRYQQHLLAEGKQLPEGQPPLKRKPTFAMWKAIAVSAKAKAEAKPTEVQEFADENDLAWNEDEEKGEATQEK